MNEDEKAMLIVIIIFLIFSILISFIFIYYFVDCKKISAMPLITCFIFLNLFVILNVLTNADIMLTSLEDFKDAYDLYDSIFFQFLFLV